jgi:hypothetical protein
VADGADDFPYRVRRLGAGALLAAVRDCEVYHNNISLRAAYAADPPPPLRRGAPTGCASRATTWLTAPRLARSARSRAPLPPTQNHDRAQSLSRRHLPPHQ